MRLLPKREREEIARNRVWQALCEKFHKVFEGVQNVVCNMSLESDMQNRICFTCGNYFVVAV